MAFFNTSGFLVDATFPATHSPTLRPTPDPHLADLQQKLALTRLLCQKVLLPTIVLIGVLGNFLNIAVLTRRWMRSSTNFYLTALAVYDIMYLVFALTMSFHHYAAIQHADWYIRYRKPFGKPFVDTASNTGVWLTLTFTIERFIGVCHPMKGKRWCTPERAKIIIFCVCFITAVITFPEFFEHYVVEEIRNNVTIVELQTSQFAQHGTYRWGYQYSNQTLFTFLPLILLLLFNSLLIRAVTKASKSRKAMVNQQVSTSQRQQVEQHRITVMLISVVIVFLICQLPQAILNLYFQYLTATNTMTPSRLHVLLIINNVCNLLVMTNSSINFVLYSSFSTKFRRTFKKLFCKCVYGMSPELNVVFSDYNSCAERPIKMRTAIVKTPPTTAPRETVGTPRMKNGYVEVTQETEVGDSV